MHRIVLRRRTHAGAGFLLVITAALLWGTAGLVGALVHERSGLSAPSIGFWRLALGAAGTMPLLLRRGTAHTLRPERHRLLAVGAALAAYQVCFYAAVTLSGVSLATMVTLGISPVLIGAGSHVMLGETPRRSTVVALGAALVGLVLLVGTPTRGVGPSAALAGVAFAVASAIGYAGVTLSTRRRPEGAPVAAFAAASFWVGALVTVPLAVWDGLTVPRDGITLLLLAYLGVGPTALAYLLFFRGLRTVEATTASVLTLIEPATATLLAVLLLGERLGTWGAAGSALLLATAAVLAVVQARPARPAQTAGL